VVASVRDPAKRDAVAALGSVAVDPAEVAAHGPYDVVLELVGAPNLPTDLRCLATGGRIVVIGVGAGANVELDLLELMRRRARISASMLRSRPLEEKSVVARRVEHHVLPLLADGRITVPIDQRFAFADAPTAYEHFAAGRKLGKIILEK
jgi:NADPH:quinone reductase-like Zn-dependent oxidoreductase